MGGGPQVIKSLGAYGGERVPGTRGGGVMKSQTLCRAVLWGGGYEMSNLVPYRALPRT